MVYWVNCPHTVRKPECKGLGTHLSDDLKWSEELLREFAGRTGRAEELSLDKDLVSDLEVRRWSSSGIRRTLILTLRGFDVFLEELMQFI